MSGTIAPVNRGQGKDEISFFDRHFAKMAFAVSTLALLILAPLALILGTAAGIAIHYYMEPDLKLQATDPILTVPNTVFAIVGAAAAFVGLTPVGLVGGTIFRLIPLVSSLAIGDTAYRAFRSI